METTRANAHRLFLGCRQKPSFSDSIQIRRKDEAVLKAARTDIRTRLRREMQRYSDLLPSAQFFESAADNQIARVIARKSGRDMPELSVKFLTQGSIAYGTAVSPCHEGKQQLDLDDGIYVPMYFIDDDRPLYAAMALFQAVETALAPLCQERGWVLIGSDHPDVKKTCVRVELDKRMHIDLPIYAIPDNEYQQFAEARAQAERIEGPISIERALELRMPGFRIDPDKVHLAHRTKGWEISDPRKIQEWFQNNILRYGQSLRRACRYLKAWRDFIWINGGPSSIVLMVCAVGVLKELEQRPTDNRDDLLALRIAERLPDFFSGPIPNPVLPPEDAVALNDGWTVDEQQQYKQEALKMGATLATALNDAPSSISVVAHFRRSYGERMPDAPEAVSFAETEQYAEVIAHKPAVVAAPMVKPAVSA